jgi:hypothetical protein
VQSLLDVSAHIIPRIDTDGNPFNSDCPGEAAQRIVGGAIESLSSRSRYQRHVDMYADSITGNVRDT